MSNKFWPIVDQLNKLQPGQEIQFDRLELKDLMTLPGFLIEEYLMEKVAGSCFSIRMHVDELNGRVIYKKLEQPLPPESGLRTYVSPDRRHFYRQRFDGLWALKDVKIIDEQRYI